jgi:hypothetical protein
MLDDVRLYDVKRVSGICESAPLEMRFHILQQSVAGGFAGEFNCYAALVIRCGRRRCAKFAATNSPQAGQGLPANLINHAAYFALASKFMAQAKFPSVS